MSGGTVYIISLKFAPGLKKEFLLLGENIHNHGGVDVKYLISENYEKLGGDADGIIYIPMKEGIKGMAFDMLRFANGDSLIQFISSNPPSFICFYNPHPLNPRLAYLIRKKFPKAILALYLHDPYKPDKSHYGLLKSNYIRMVEFVQGLTIKYINIVISPSVYSSKLFKSRYPDFDGQNYIAPLLIPDQKVIDGKKRKYFSIVGIAHPATGHDTFIELVNCIAKSNLDYNFAIISSSNLLPFLGKLSENAKNKLKVINKRVITDSEINELISESYAVFRLDKEVTQSGVIPVAYMNKTPVIVRNIPGLTQHVWQKKTGYIVPFNCTPEDLVKAMDYVRDNFAELSSNARNSYEDIWAEWNFEKYYGWLIELLKSY